MTQTLLALWFATVLRVVDGDTLHVNVQVWPEQALSTTIRLAGVDAPELHAHCDSERAKAIEARDALRQIVGNDVVLYDLHKDKYGRWLAQVVNRHTKQDAATELLNRGLVRAYDGGKRGGWCEEEGQASQ